MIEIHLPEIFLIEGKNASDVSKCLYKFINHVDEKIGVNFSRIKEVTNGDVIILMAQVEKSIYSNRNSFHRIGAMPKSKKVWRVFEKVNILHQHKTFELSDSYTSDDIEKYKMLFPEVIDNIVKELKRVGFREYYEPFYVFLTELIGNAIEHGIQHRKISWWLTKQIDNKNRIIKYCFVDMGVGIINSHRQAGLPLRYLISKDEKVLTDAFNGKLKSSTKQPNRGRGLPQIKSMVDKGWISNLRVITNRVSMNCEFNDPQFDNIPEFIGTYYSWTLNKSNYEKWKEQST